MSRFHALFVVGRVPSAAASGIGLASSCMSLDVFGACGSTIGLASGAVSEDVFVSANNGIGLNSNAVPGTTTFANASSGITLASSSLSTDFYAASHSSINLASGASENVISDVFVSCAVGIAFGQGSPLALNVSNGVGIASTVSAFLQAATGSGINLGSSDYPIEIDVFIGSGLRMASATQAFAQTPGGNIALTSGRYRR